MDILIQYASENYIDIAAATIGLLYLYLEYKANTWMWVVSIVMALFFVYIFYSAHLYASMGIYMYFFIASIYGLFAWLTKSRNKETGEHVMLRLPSKNIPLVLALVVGAFAALLFILVFWTENSLSIQIGDALTTSLNIVALWMAARKWAEQWCLLIPANLISAILLLVQGENASAFMFFIYFVVSIFGYFNWKRMAMKA